MALHLHTNEVSIGICFVLGALHALEPGHGKTAFAAHLMTEKKSLGRPLLLALTTAVTHAFSILLISMIVHELLHAAIDSASTDAIYRWVNLVSGLILIGVGFILLRRFTPPGLVPVGSKARQASTCPCPIHRAQETKPADRRWRTTAIGFAVGLIPCPSALAALSTAVSTGDLAQAVMVVFMFSLGIFVSLAAMGVVLSSFSKTLSPLTVFHRRPRLPGQIQFIALSATGAWHILAFWT